MAEPGVGQAGGLGAVAAVEPAQINGGGDYNDVPGQHGLGVVERSPWDPEDEIQCR